MVKFKSISKALSHEHSPPVQLVLAHLYPCAKFEACAHGHVADNCHEHIHQRGFLQYSYSGTATDKPLMTWLSAYAFPREKGHSDAGAASREYTKLAKRLAAHGTTTALVFGTLHKEACQQLALCMQKQGLRGYIGKVCMDRQVYQIHLCLMSI